MSRLLTSVNVAVLERKQGLWLYGIIGSGGFGKIFDRTYTVTDTDSNYVAKNFANSFEGIGSIMDFNYRGIVNGDTFNLYPN
ncbi:Uncharacterised protein [Actinobacillus pleuropneumoniae]|nr:Uncharacterised protein [Actinobacillus pleuropneumoniae]